MKKPVPASRAACPWPGERWACWWWWPAPGSSCAGSPTRRRPRGHCRKRVPPAAAPVCRTGSSERVPGSHRFPNHARADASRRAQPHGLTTERVMDDLRRPSQHGRRASMWRTGETPADQPAARASPSRFRVHAARGSTSRTIQTSAGDPMQPGTPGAILRPGRGDPRGAATRIPWRMAFIAALKAEEAGNFRLGQAGLRSWCASNLPPGTGPPSRGRLSPAVRDLVTSRWSLPWRSASMP